MIVISFNNCINNLVINSTLLVIIGKCKLTELQFSIFDSFSDFIDSAH